MAVLDDFGLRVGRYLTTLPTLTNEEIAELTLDSSGRLIISGRVLGGDVGTSTDAMLNIGGIRKDAEGAFAGVADGDYTPAQFDSNGRLKVATLVSVEPSDAEYAEDAAHTSGDTGLHMLAVRQDTLASSVDTDGDYASLKLNSLGELYVTDTSVLSKLTEIDTVLDTLSKARDSVAGGTDTGIPAMVIRRDADTTITEADGDYTMLNVTDKGYLKVQLKESTVSANITPLGTEAYTVTDALAAAGDGLATITSAATPFVTVASLAVGAGTTAYIYGWQWVCDQNAEARLVTDDTTDVIVYKVSANSSSQPNVSEHWSEGVIEIAGAANLEIKVQIKKRKAAGGDALGGSSLHVRTV